MLSCLLDMHIYALFDGTSINKNHLYSPNISYLRNMVAVSFDDFCDRVKVEGATLKESFSGRCCKMQMLQTS